MITDIKKLVVKYNDKTVGYLAQLDEGIAFQYDEKWLKNGFNISPFSLPLEDRVFINRKDIFGGAIWCFCRLSARRLGRASRRSYAGKARHKLQSPVSAHQAHADKRSGAGRAHL